MPDTLARRLGLLSILLGVASLALLAVAVWGFRARGWHWPRVYDLAGWGVWAAGAGVLVALVGLVIWLRRKQGGASAVLLGLILSLPAASLGAAFEIAARTTPPINDISTDTEDPPVFWFMATPSDYPAQNAGPQRAAYPDVRPLDLRVSADEAFAAALALVEDRGWEVLSADLAESQIEAIATSRVFGFDDEVAIRARARVRGDPGTRCRGRRETSARRCRARGRRGRVRHP